MKIKIILSISILFLFGENLFSQNQKIDKKELTKLYNVRFTDIGGNQYDGKFISMNDSAILFYNPTKKMFYSIKRKDVYSLKISNKKGYGNAVLEGTIVTTAIASVIALPLDPGMLGHGFLITVWEATIGMPAAIIGSFATKNIEKVNIDYIANEINKLETVKPLLQKKTYKTCITDSVISLSANTDSFRIKVLKKPKKFYHPDYTSAFHVNIGYSPVFNNIGQQMISELKNSDFRYQTDDDQIGQTSTIRVGLEVNISKNLALTMQYNTETVSYVKGRTVYDDFVSTWHAYRSFYIGTEYRCKPVNRLFLKHYEFSANASFTYSLYNYHVYFLQETPEGGNPEYSDTNYQFPGLEIGVSASYYISRNISLTANLNTNYMYAKLKDYSNFSANGEPANILSPRLNIVSFNPVIGIGFHF